MKIAFAEAHDLATLVLQRHGMPADHANIVADHLVDAAAAGHGFAGLPRVLALVDQMKGMPPASPIEIIRQGPNSLLLDGGGTNGYVTSLMAIDKAIELAGRNGFCVAGVRNTWFSGRLAYYVERAARAGFVALHTANTMARVAPAGGMDRIFGTNPVAFAFPSDPEPVVVDFGTGMTTWGETLLRRDLGRALEPGCAVNPAGEPTIDPAEALEGAFLPWGGHRGYGLSMVVQMFALMCGSDVVVNTVQDCGFFFLVFNPELLMPLSELKKKTRQLVETIERSQPVPGQDAVRVPGRSSTKKRVAARIAGEIDVDEDIYNRLRALL
jgi:LDH2 family malate/lactate/ureidoglycolate dehydrogenase